MRSQKEEQKNQLNLKENEVFQHANKFYHIEQDKYECRETYLERVWFILNQLNDKSDFDEIVKSSRFYSAKKIYGCEY